MIKNRVKYICDNCDGRNECVAWAAAGQYPVLSNLHCVYDTGGRGHWRKADPDPVRERGERVRGMDAEVGFNHMIQRDGDGKPITVPASVPANVPAIEGDRQPDSPPYYTSGIVQCWDLIFDRRGVDGCLAMLDKYTFRAGKKPGVPLAVDLRKIVNWAEFLLGKIGGEE